MEHTLGPWRVDEDLVVAADGYDVCEISTRKDSKDGSAEMDANAALIAAAPELLEACEAFTAQVEKWWRMLDAGEDIGEMSYVLTELAEQGRAAIVKAQGER